MTGFHPEGSCFSVWITCFRWRGHRRSLLLAVIHPMQDHLRGCALASACPGDFRNLFRILLDEVAADRGYLVVEAKRPIELHNRSPAEKLPESAHDRDVAAGKAVDGLPIIPDREEFEIFAALQHRFQQPIAADGNVLKFIDDDVFPGNREVARLYISGRGRDHVIEIDLSRFLAVQRGLILLVEELKQLCKGFARGRRLRP